MKSLLLVILYYNDNYTCIDFVSLHSLIQKGINGFNSSVDSFQLKVIRRMDGIIVHNVNNIIDRGVVLLLPMAS